MRRKYIWNGLGIIFLLVSLVFLQNLFMPKYASGIVEGGMIETYYDEPKNHDVIFIGDCEVYGNFSPVTLWKEYGIKSFIRGSAQQLIWHSYYLMEETLKYEKPDVIVFNVLSLKYNEPQREAYNRMTLDGMKLSMTKIRAIQASMLEEESLVEYIFPFLRYHTRWNELTQDDFNYLIDKPDLFHNGYYMRVDVNPVTSIPRKRPLPDYSFGENAMSYLDRMVALAKEYDVELVLIKAPTIYPVWYDEWDDFITEYADKQGLMYVNLLERVDEIGIDFQTDTYDGGLHMNLEGAEKLSRYFGNILVETFELEDHRNNLEVKGVWSEKVAFYQEMIDSQVAEIERYGHLVSWGNPREEDEEE